MLKLLSAALLAALLGAVLALSAAPAGAVAVDQPLDDPALEARARSLHKLVRCLVCQNQSISDSNADLARDLRQVVRERLLLGDSDEEALAYLVARYGDWVLLRPPMRPATWLLWGAPVLLVAAGALFVVRRRKRRLAGAAPLSEQERQRLEALLDDGSEA